jgi:sialate O-acetylesterase
MPLRLLCLVAFLISSLTARADLTLPPLFSDHMVLQSGKASAIWGRGNASAGVRVRFCDETGAVRSEAAASVAADGKWALKLPPLPAGTAGFLEIRSASETKKIEDVLVGEVWLGSGQSNMEYRTAASNVPEKIAGIAREEAAAATPQIRFFVVEKKAGQPKPLEEVGGRWTIITPGNVGGVSAVSWYFAQALHEKLEVPVGMIVSCWGGTPVEAWMSREMLDGTKASKEIWERHEKLIASYTPEKVQKLRDEMAAWQKANPTPELQRKNAKAKPKYPYWAESSRVPVRLYNGMLHGLIPYTLQGVIWYQGEANASRPGIYGELIRAMVNGWRKAWGEELPFYYVELAGHKKPQGEPSEGGLAVIREAQAEVLQLPKTGVATAVDLGLSDDIHPPYKKEVGQRLAGLALSEVHGLNVPAKSPSYRSSKVEGDKIRLSFDDASGLRSRDGGEVKGFAITDGEGQWKWAQAEVEGEEVIVWSEGVSQPSAVRYGWANFPVLSLVNAAGLPLRPFRTDTGGGDQP